MPPPIVSTTTVPTMRRILFADALLNISGCVGIAVGKALGLLVGLGEGPLVGLGVGLRVGVILGGALLGVRVGIRDVGAGVGANDGLRVATTTAMLEVSTVTVVLSALLALLWKEGELNSVRRAEDRSVAELTPPRLSEEAVMVKATDHE